MPRYSDLPSHRGERNLAIQLDGLGDRRAHMWFGIDYLPGVKDLDLLLLHEKAGCFAVEVKAVPLRAIRTFSHEFIEIEGRARGNSPQLQAYNAAIDLRNYLQPRMALPFLVATVCWPLISRREWNAYWDDERVTGEFADRMLFREDLTRGAQALADRLRFIYHSPPVRQGAARAFTFSADTREELRKELRVEAAPRPLPSDAQRLAAIEQELAREATSQVPTGSASRVLFAGHPGTGKTFRLLQIGIRHAIDGANVLLMCFNKVLATDLRRLVSFIPALRGASGGLEIRDAYEVLRTHSRGSLEVDVADTSYDEWAALVLAEARERDQGQIYSTVLIDEGQDMRQWMFELVQWLATPTATWAVAAGRGQELYGDPAPWLREYENSATRVPLRRVFRNTRPVFQAAQVLYESDLDTQRSANLAARLRRSSAAAASAELSFLRPEGDAPELRFLDDTALGRLQPGTAVYADRQHRLMVDEYERVLRQELEHLRSEEWPSDLLVLVPSSVAAERTWARAAIERMRGDYDLLDYTDDRQRRVPGYPQSIRLCTYHSARGIEGSRVLLFGFEHTDAVSRAVGIPPGHLAYIALTRAVAECVVVLPRSQAHAPVARALEVVLYELGA